MASALIDGVVKKSGGARAVDDVSLDVRDGELSFLLGRSGSCKTTLLRMIAGFSQPHRQHTLRDDTDVGTLALPRRNTVMAFQNSVLLPHRSSGSSA